MMDPDRDAWRTGDLAADLAAEDDWPEPPPGAEDRVLKGVYAGLGMALAPELLEAAHWAAEATVGSGAAVTGAAVKGAVVAKGAAAASVAASGAVGTGATVAGGGLLLKGVLAAALVGGGGLVVKKTVLTPSQAPTVAASVSPTHTRQFAPEAHPKPSPFRAVTPKETITVPIAEAIDSATETKDPVEALEPVQPAPAAVEAVKPKTIARPKVRTAATAAPQRHDAQLSAERSLLTRARRHIAGGRAKDALRVLGRHTRRFPKGRLSEERKVLKIRALLAAHRPKDARREAQNFLKKHPQSLLRRAVESLIP